MSDTPERVAREFHDAYEALAPEFGYTTRPETRVFDPTSPNGRLMVAVCAALQLVRESRLREVEARLREVEAERDALARHIERRADGMDLLTQALRAERDALLPLARAGLNAYDYVLAKEQYGNATVPLLDRVSIDESLSAARAILDRLDKGGA